MRILVIGGSSFVGRHIVAATLADGHQLTLFNRGRTDAEAFPHAEHLVGDRDHDLSALTGRFFDAVIDVCAYVPRQVRSLLEELGPRARHYTLISTISVYGQDVAPHGFTEDAGLLEPAWDETFVSERYGELKVACEIVARELVGERLLIVRPGFVVGPHDPTHRFTYWVERVAAGEQIVAGDADQPLQVLDGRDLAALVSALVGKGTVDVVHAAGPDPAPSFADILADVATGVGAPAPIHWGGWRAELPLASPEGWWPKMRADSTRACGYGLRWRPLPETARDTLAWVRAERAAGRYPEHPGVGLTAEQERAALAEGRTAQ